jgi:hypothetical protein
MGFSIVEIWIERLKQTAPQDGHTWSKCGNYDLAFRVNEGRTAQKEEYYKR